MELLSLQTGITIAIFSTLSAFVLTFVQIQKLPLVTVDEKTNFVNLVVLSNFSLSPGLLSILPYFLYTEEQEPYLGTIIASIGGCALAVPLFFRMSRKLFGNENFTEDKSAMAVIFLAIGETMALVGFLTLFIYSDFDALHLLMGPVIAISPVLLMGIIYAINEQNSIDKDDTEDLYLSFGQTMTRLYSMTLPMFGWLAYGLI
tara:strand:- start:41 stop:649 length:609 start_codon:yes stop_codon:yes gene_type:complete